MTDLKSLCERILSTEENIEIPIDSAIRLAKVMLVLIEAYETFLRVNEIHHAHTIPGVASAISKANEIARGEG